MSITIVYNQVEKLSYGQKNDLIADQDTVLMAKKVAEVLAKKGHTVKLYNLNEKTILHLDKIASEILFNLCGGIGNLPHSEGLAAAALFKTGRIVIGSGQKALELTTDKVATKKILIANNLPTPKYFEAFNGTPLFLKGLTFPLIIKPACEDCSLGISQDSVFHEEKGIAEKARELNKIYHGPVLIEEYIDGRELRVSIVGNKAKAKVLPVSELVFGKSFLRKNRIFDFYAKWIPGSKSYEDTYAVAPAKISREVLKLVEKISLKAYSLTGCADYGRIDIRLDKNDKPFILEVNANPAIGPDDALATSAAAAGIKYADLLEMIIGRR